MNVAKGKEIFILSILSLFILWISPALAFDPKDDRMEVNIQLNMSWTTGKGGKNIQEKGSASIKIFGEIDLEKKHKESLHYRAMNLKATYSFTNTYYYVGGSCINCCSEELPLTIERGSGSIEPKNFKLGVSVGRQGNRMAQEEGCLEPVNGVYQLSALVPISTSFEYVQRGCFPSPYPPTGSGYWWGKREFDIYGSKPLDTSGIYGSYNLTGGGGFFVGYSIDAKVWDYCGKTKQIIMDERSILAGNAQANLNWQIGKGGKVTEPAKKKNPCTPLGLRLVEIDAIIKAYSDENLFKKFNRSDGKLTDAERADMYQEAVENYFNELMKNKEAASKGGGGKVKTLLTANGSTLTITYENVIVVNKDGSINLPGYNEAMNGFIADYGNRSAGISLLNAALVHEKDHIENFRRGKWGDDPQGLRDLELSAYKKEREQLLKDLEIMRKRGDCK